VLVPLASLWLALAPPESAAAESDQPEPAAAEPDLSEAKRLFDEGIARYDAADFSGAIEVFTLALSELRKQGVGDFRIRGLLLFNIGRAHMRAFGIDDDVGHLRQAKTIFTSFVEEAESHPGEVDAADIDEARGQLVEIDRLLEAEANAPATATTDKPKRDRPKRDRPAPKGDPKQLRASGIGLLAGGGVLLVGGVGMLAWGSGYGAKAEAAVAELDGLELPPDTTAYADGEAFIDAERRKGTAWMAVGGVSMTLGVVGVAVGIRQLVTAKRVEKHRARPTAWTPTASFGRGGAFLGISGRF
jgi:hypothetical protein